jgi:excisionase family DNA binding protein
MTEFLTVDEVAARLHLAKRTVQEYCRKGIIGSTKTERKFLIPPESVDEYLKIRR